MNIDNIFQSIRSKLDELIDKLYSGKITKKEMKQNLLVNLSLLVRHFIITHKNLVMIILAGIAASVILIAVYISSYEKSVNEANKYFESALSFYRKAFVEKDLTPDQRMQSLNDSINRFQYVINTFAGTPLKSDSIIYQGNAYFEMADYNNALKKYQEIIDTKPKFYFADYVLINIAKCYEQFNNIQGAITAYQSVIDNYPDKPAVAEAKYNLAKLKELTNKVNEALQDYQNLITAHPQSLWAREARIRAMFLQTLSKPAQKPQTPPVGQPPGQQPKANELPLPALPSQAP